VIVVAFLLFASACSSNEHPETHWHLGPWDTIKILPLAIPFTLLWGFVSVFPSKGEHSFSIPTASFSPDGKELLVHYGVYKPDEGRQSGFAIWSIEKETLKKLPSAP